MWGLAWLSGVGLRACGCGICVGLRVCGNDGLCGLVKQEVGRPAQLPRGPRGHGHRPSPDKGEPRRIRSSVWAASLLPPHPHLPPELQTHPTDHNVSSSPANSPPSPEGPGSPAEPPVEMRPCPLRQGLSMAKQVGESIRQPDFKAQIHRSERAEQFLPSRYVLCR